KRQDYAHTPDALEQALQALRPVAAQRGGRLWCVFGCGGNRDRAKRPLMGRIAQHRADAVIATSDNPRNEDPGAILHEILLGTVAGTTVQVEPEREAAIARAIAEADARDVVLIAGKGHEDYQETAGVRRPFSDAAQARAALALPARESVPTGPKREVLAQLAARRDVFAVKASRYTPAQVQSRADRMRLGQAKRRTAAAVAQRLQGQCA
uniref:glutamate ligase domain-containing protein n=1 Tax=Raoultella sp. 18093 TaxID=2681425 RepID=UPI00272DB1C2